MIVAGAPIPVAQLRSTPVLYKIGLAIMQQISPMKLPTLAPYGSTIPLISSPRLKLKIIGTAGRIVSVLLVRSFHGSGKMLIDSPSSALLIDGSATYTTANAIPNIAPKLKTRQRHVSLPPLASASAVIPCAATGAIG